MSISSKIEEIALNKSVIKAAIASKSPKVPPTDELSQWPDSIMSIQTGEGPRYDPPFEYVRPSDWPDLETVLSQHPASEKGYGYAYAMLVEGQSPVSNYNYIEVPANSAGCRHYVTSWGLDEDCPNITQEWVLSDSNTYSKYEWIVVYTDSANDLTTWGPRGGPYIFRWLVWFYAPGAMITNTANDGFNGILSIREFEAKTLNVRSAFLNTVYASSLPCRIRLEKYVDRDTGGKMNGSFFPSYLIGDVEFEIEMRSGVKDIHDFLAGQFYITSIRPFSLPSGVTNTTNAFLDCHLIRKLDLSGWDMSGVTNAQIMFKNCTSLEIVDTTGWNMSSLVYMNNMFEACRSLVSIKGISDWGVSSKITQMVGPFASCTSLKGSMNLSKWNTSNVASMSNMFRDCLRIESIDLSTWDMSSVTNVSAMFQSCWNLAFLNLGGWDFGSSGKLTNMSNMFDGCYSLKEIDLLGWDVRNVTNMYLLFGSCRSLTEIDLTGWDFSSLTNMIGMFSGCCNLKEVRLSGSTFGKVPSMQQIFYSCTKLETLDVSDWDTSSVTNMSYMFGGCRSLGSIDISQWDMSKVTTANNMFDSCNSLQSVKMPNVSNVYSSQFSGCHSCLLYDFRKCTSVPSLANTNAFNNINANAYIVVPDSLYSSWIAASNWSNNAIKPHIISVSDYEAL